MSKPLQGLTVQPKQPPNFDVDTFSPPVTSRETTIAELVDAVAGPEPLGVVVYPFRGRDFSEYRPYEDEDPLA